MKFIKTLIENDAANKKQIAKTVRDGAYNRAHDLEYAYFENAEDYGDAVLIAAVEGALQALKELGIV